MENANPSSSTSNSKFIDPIKKIKIKSWLEDSMIVDSLDGSDEIEYFDTFSTLEELEYHEWLLKYPKPSWEKGTVTFKKDNEKITFKMPHKMEAFNHIDIKDVNTDSIPPLVLEKNDDRRKAHLLEDNQIQSVWVFDEVFLALGWHLDEIHVIWAHLEKKRMRLRTCIKNHQEVLFSERGDGVAGIKRRRHDLSSDGVWILATASQRRFLALGWHLEEIHVTWAYLEKKRIRLRTCTKNHQEVLFLERGDGVAGIKRRCHDLSGDGVWILATMSQCSRLKVNLEPSTWRRRQEYKVTPSRR
ncbi:hypothetical protein Tco_0453976 [Tanacetum coccineum]